MSEMTEKEKIKFEMFLTQHTHKRDTELEQLRRDNAQLCNIKRLEDMNAKDRQPLRLDFAQTTERRYRTANA